MSSWKYFVRLHQDDNLITVTKETPAGTMIYLDPDRITIDRLCRLVTRSISRILKRVDRNRVRSGD
jgi:hypothetical protein